MKLLKYWILLAISTTGVGIGSMIPFIYPRVAGQCAECFAEGEGWLLALFFISAPIAVYSLWRIVK